jgi:hypothetical protein
MNGQKTLKRTMVAAMAVLLLGVGTSTTSQAGILEDTVGTMIVTDLPSGEWSGSGPLAWWEKESSNLESGGVPLMDFGDFFLEMDCEGSSIDYDCDVIFQFEGLEGSIECETSKGTGRWDGFMGSEFGLYALLLERDECESMWVLGLEDFDNGVFDQGSFCTFSVEVTGRNHLEAVGQSFQLC